MKPRNNNRGPVYFKKAVACFAIAWFSALTSNAQPLNDSFNNRAAIPGNSTTVTGSIAGATSEPAEPVVANISSGQTAWWTWTAPSNGIIALTVNGTGFSPFLTVYSGNHLASLSLIASNNYLACYESAQCGCHWRIRDQTTFHVWRNQAYALAVDSAVIMDATWVNPPAAPVPFVIPWFDFDENGNGIIHYTTNYELIQTIQPDGGPWELVQTTNILAGGDFQLGLQFTPAPSNDDFETRLALTGARTHIIASNAGATKENFEPNHSGNPGGSSVWYSWTAPTSGRVTLSTNEVPPYAPPSWNNGPYGLTQHLLITSGNQRPTCGNEIDQNPPPSFFPLFAAYTDSLVDSLIPANYRPLALAAFPHAISFDVIEGETCKIAFDGNMGTTGTVPMYLALSAPASNDDFKNRIKVRGIYVAASGYNAGATRESGEPAPIAGSRGKTVWWSWTAPVSGRTSISLAGSDFAFPMAVYAGSKLSTLRQLVSGTGSVSFEAVTGQTYQIAISDADQQTGAINLALQAPIREVSLSRMLGGRRRIAILRFTAVPGQKILLQRSNDGVNWQNRGVVLARDAFVDFLVAPPPRIDGPRYRAIIIDTFSR